MSQIYTFSKSVQGQLHILNQLPCQDSSGSFSAEDGSYHIAVVADGHGSRFCSRSDYGSEAAAANAVECLKQFAEAALMSSETEDRFYKDILSERYRQMTIRHLTDTILAGWHDQITEHYRNHPLSETELSLRGELALKRQISSGQAEELYPHFYGTTLIAALRMAGCLILIQQGDGRCCVFFRDGSQEQPVPWDIRCQDNATTSLCDSDAKESFRSCVIYWDKRHDGAVTEEKDRLNSLTNTGTGRILFAESPVPACYLGSDGVEDAYRDTYEELGGSHVEMGGVYTFYKDLTCQLLELVPESAFEQMLEDWLPVFSANGKFSGSGSGDDVSVAGIVDLESIQEQRAAFEADVRIYELEEQLFWTDDQLRSKQRKHGILKRRMEEAGMSLQEVRQETGELYENIQNLIAQRNDCLEEKDDKDREIENCIEDFQSVNQIANQIEWKSRINSQEALGFLKKLSSNIMQQEHEKERLKSDLSIYDDLISQAEELRREKQEKLTELEQKYESAKAAFDEYDQTYQKLADDKKSIEEQIRAVKHF